MNERDMKRLLNTEADTLVRDRKGTILKTHVKTTAGDAEPSFRGGFLSVLSAAAAGLLIVSLFVVCLIPVAKKAYEDAHPDVGAASGQTVTGEETPYAGTSADPEGSTDETAGDRDPDETQREYVLSEGDEKFYVFLVETLEILWKQELNDQQKLELRRCIADKVFGRHNHMTRESLIREGVVDDTFPESILG